MFRIIIVAVVLWSNYANAQLSNLKFDVDLELDHFVVSNVRDLDGTEDLYGNIYCIERKALSKIKTGRLLFWGKTRSSANDGNFRNGSAPVDVRKTLFTNLTYEELRNLQISVGGTLYDHELLLSFTPFFICADCQATNQAINEFDPSRLYDNFDKFRTLKFSEMTTTLASIDNLLNNGLYQALNFGVDKFFELNYYESGKKEDGWVKIMWKVWVKPHR